MKPCQKSMMNYYNENGERFLAVNCIFVKTSIIDV